MRFCNEQCVCVILPCHFKQAKLQEFPFQDALGCDYGEENTLRSLGVEKVGGASIALYLLITSCMYLYDNVRMCVCA